MQRLSKSRLTVLALVALLPSFLKRVCYRLFFGYKIGKRVRIGLSIIDARECRIDDDVRIGHLNLVVRVKQLEIGDHCRIGHLNIIRGGDEVSLGRYCEIMRMNEINSIPDPDDGGSYQVVIAPGGIALHANQRARKTAYLARLLQGADAAELELLAGAADLLERLLAEGP